MKVFLGLLVMLFLFNGCKKSLTKEEIRKRDQAIKEIDTQKIIEHIKKKLKKGFREKLTRKDLLSIQKLELRKNIQNISYLKNLKNLMFLTLVNNKIIDLYPLKDLRELRSILIVNSKIQNLNDLRNLNQLVSLNIVNTDLEDISGLKNLRNLKDIILTKNNIKNITPLSNLVDLEILKLDDNNIEDISALKHIRCRISLKNNPIKNYSLFTKKRNSNGYVYYISKTRKIRDENCFYNFRDYCTDIFNKCGYKKLYKYCYNIEFIKFNSFHVNKEKLKSFCGYLKDKKNSKQNSFSYICKNYKLDCNNIQEFDFRNDSWKSFCNVTNPNLSSQ